MEERDVSGEMQRSQMEQICTETFNRVERTLRGLLHNASKFISYLRYMFKSLFEQNVFTHFFFSELRAEDISAVEIVGGSTRVPAVKNLIEQVFGKQASTTLNQVSLYFITLGKTIVIFNYYIKKIYTVYINFDYCLH